MYEHGYNRRGKRHPLHWVWAGMKQRCNNPNFECYERYGARGITVCDEWNNSSAAFIEWALKNGWEKGLQIDRIDNDAGYSPDNCRFVTPYENSQNQRPRKKWKGNNRFIGVLWDKGRNKWFAKIHHKKDICIGYFSNEIDAAVCRDSYVINHGLNRTLNFPQPAQIWESTHE